MADNDKPNYVDTFVSQLQKGNNTEAGDAFKDALRDKVGDALDTSRKEYASSLFQSAADVMTGTTTPVADTTDAAAEHSDSKPEVADALQPSATQDEVQQAFNQDTAPDNTGE
tara:strand:+ start:603 stop:941 length:339 start_codon:yes stop_codon:yes gene_type:complete